MGLAGRCLGRRVKLRGVTFELPFQSKTRNPLRLLAIRLRYWSFQRSRCIMHRMNPHLVALTSYYWTSAHASV